jgi:hypothetical protein
LHQESCPIDFQRLIFVNPSNQPSTSPDREYLALYPKQ